MYQAPQQLVQLGKSNIEAALTLATLTLQTTEKLIDLQLRSARDALDHGAKSAKALAEAKSVQDLLSLQASTAQPGIEKMLAYSRSLYEVATDTQTQVTRIVGSRVAEVSDGLMAAVEQAAKTAPTGSESAVSALKSAIAAASSAYDALAKNAKPAAEPAATAQATAKNGRRKH